MKRERRAAIMVKIARRLRVDPVTGCHLWTGPDSGKIGRGKGYPRMCLDGQTVAVHIVVFTHYYGYIPSKKQVDHICCQRMCCNPEHLELVTHRENQRRKKRPKCQTGMHATSHSPTTSRRGPKTPAQKLAA